MNSKEKGKRVEREFAQVCRQHGYDVRRINQFCGNTGEAADCIGLDGIHCEVKRVERLNICDAMEQAVRDSKDKEDYPAVFHRKNNHEWLVTMRLEDWFELDKKW